MAKQTVNLGTSANKGDGDPLRTAFDKINDNFNELYAGNFADPASISSSIIPSVTNTYDLGSSTKRWSDLHVNDFIYLNGSRLEVTAGGALLIGGSPPSEVQDTIGSVFGDDSTLLVDGVNNVIPKANIEDSANWDTAFGWGNHTAGGYAPQTTTYTKTEVDSAISAVNTLDGDITGSVFADDSTLLVDGIAGKVMLTTNTTTELTEGTNLYYTDVRADARITNAGSANWNAAFGWGNHASAGYQVAGAPYDGDITGSVFGDDSTLLVDGVNGLIPSSVISGTEATNWNTAYGWGDHSVAGYLTSVPAQTFTSLTGKPTTLAGYGITDAATAAQGVLAASALQAETITLATLKTEVAASADFAAFKGRIAAL